MVVNTTFVAEKVFVDGERSLHRSIVVELILDALNSSGVHDGVVFASELGPGLVGTGAGVSATAGVTIAGSVRPAGIRHNTGVLEVLPDVSDVPTITTITVGFARDGVLGCKDDVLTGNAESVRKSINGTESPGCTALLLVSDGVDAFGELFSSRIKVSGGSDVVSLIGGRSSSLEVEIGAEEVQELLSCVISEGISLRDMSLPTLSLSLDLSNDVIVNGV
jgi:hypothetical protein